MSKVTKLGIQYITSLNDIKYLNSGGCLFSCLGVYTRLKKDGLNNPKIVIVQFEDDDEYYTIEDNKSFIDGFSEYASSSTHFGISFDGGKTVYDSKGYICEDRYTYELIIPNDMIEEFCKNALTFGSWNDLFNRRYGVAQINKRLEIRLKRYL